MNRTGISAVIPVYNDRASLERALPESIRVFSELGSPFELIIAEDGSTDGSTEFVRSFSEMDQRVRLLHSDERLGRGRALTRAFSEASGVIVLYYDVDLATGMEHIGELVDEIRRGCDCATGSRLMPSSNTTRSSGREFASRGYNFLVRLFLSSRIYDHQCGFKAFNRERLMSLLPSVRDTHWFWDTEVLVLAQRAGYQVCEFPVKWREGRGTTVRRNDVWEMGSAILSLWWRIHVKGDCPLPTG